MSFSRRRSCPRRCGEKSSYSVEFDSPSRTVTFKLFVEQKYYIDNNHYDKCNNGDVDIKKFHVIGSNPNKSSTLPLSYRYCNERQNSKDRDGYYSDRNEIIKREREAERERGYLSDYNSKYESK